MMKIPTMKPNHRQFSGVIIETCLILLIGLSSLLTIQWLRADTLLGPETDSKTYFIKTVGFLDALPAGGWAHLGQSISGLSHASRPIFYQLISIPFLLVLGRSMDSAATVNILFQALLVFSVYQIGKLISNAKTGLLAALLVSVYPPLIQLSHIYRPHFAVSACVSLALWRLLLLYQQRSVKNIWFFIFSLVFGVLIHPTFLFLFFLPTLLGGFYILFLQTAPHRPANAKGFCPWLKLKFSDPIFLWGVIPALLLGIVLFIFWLHSNEAAWLDLIRKLCTNDLVDFRGYGTFTKGLQLDGASYFWWYLITMPKAISWVFTAFFVLGVGYAIWRRQPTHLFLVATFLGAYLVFSSLPTMVWMEFAQVLPVIALISAIWPGEAKNKILAVTFSAVLLSTSLFIYYYVNWGTGSMNRVAISMGAPVTPRGGCLTSDQVFCPIPPDHHDWEAVQVHILKTIISDPDCQVGKCGVLVLKMPVPISGDTLDYYRITKFSEAPLTVVRIPGFTFNIVPFDFEAFLQSQFIVFVDQIKNSAAYLGAAAKLVLNPPESFALSHQTIKEFNIPGGRKIRLLKRTAPLTLSEAQDVIRLLDLDEKYKFGQYRVLAPLFAQSGRFDDALQIYRKALEYEPENADLYFGLAGVYEALGQRENAVRAYRQVVAIAPGSDLALQAQNWLEQNK